MGIYVLLCGFLLSYAIYYWFHTRHERRGRGVIIAEYDPPNGIRPAMIEVIMTGNISDKLWPVTLIDLAYRNYLKIEEGTDGKHFSINLIKDFENDDNLYPYEKLVLRTIFRGRSILTFDGLKIDHGLKKEIEFALIGLKSYVVADVYRNTGAYKTPEELKQPSIGLFILLFAIPSFLLAEFEYKFSSDAIVLAWYGSMLMLLFTAIILGISSPLFHKRGFLLRERLAGFRYYLEMAEKNRLEDLPADLFQENLAYAMAFGFEKKWSGLLEHQNAKMFQKLSRIFRK